MTKNKEVTMNIQRFKLVALMFLMTVFFAEKDAFAVCWEMRDQETIRQQYTRISVSPSYVVATTPSLDPRRETLYIRYFPKTGTLKEAWALIYLKKDCEPDKQFWLYSKREVNQAIKKHSLRRLEW